MARGVSIAFFAVATVVILAVLPTLAIAGPALIIERRRPFDALRRAVELQRRNYWHLLPRALCTYLMVWLAATTVGLPFSLAALAARTGDAVTQSTASLVLATAGWVVGQIVVLPFLIAVNAVLYLDQRVRVELSP